LLLIIPAVRIVMSSGRGPTLIAVLKATGLTELATAIAFAAGLVISVLT
jgi:1,4-dihydroxy-2-naphthoate octaprenyltransferase